MSDNNDQSDSASKSFIVKLDSILEKECYYLTKIVATQIQRHGYASISKFFKNLPQPELDILLDKIKLIAGEVDEETKSKRQADIILLAAALALAEGKSVFQKEEIPELVNKLVLFSTLTDLDRQGKIKANYALFSFIDSIDSAIFQL